MNKIYIIKPSGVDVPFELQQCTFCFEERKTAEAVIKMFEKTQKIQLFWKIKMGVVFSHDEAFKQIIDVEENL